MPLHAYLSQNSPTDSGEEAKLEDDMRMKTKARLKGWKAEKGHHRRL